MAISETTLKDTMLMLIDDQNEKGGLLGKKLEAVVVDPASNWPLFAEKARDLTQNQKVDIVFGCWSSVSRKSVLPVFEELNSLLFYPVQYEGEESSRNVFYTGAAPNQQAIPAVEYLMAAPSAGSWSAPTMSIHAPPTKSTVPSWKPRVSLKLPNSSKKPGPCRGRAMLNSENRVNCLPKENGKANVQRRPDTSHYPVRGRQLRR
jgi:hypothetical protein